MITGDWEPTGVTHVDGDGRVYRQEIERGTRDYHERWTLVPRVRVYAEEETD